MNFKHRKIVKILCWLLKGKAKKGLPVGSNWLPNFAKGGKVEHSCQWRCSYLLDLSYFLIQQYQKEAYHCWALSDVLCLFDITKNYGRNRRCYESQLMPSYNTSGLVVPCWTNLCIFLKVDLKTGVKTVFGIPWHCNLEWPHLNSWD